MNIDKKWRGKSFNLTKKGEYDTKIQYTESLDCEDDETPVVLLTIGEGADHSHSSMSFDEAKEMKDFLEEFIEYYS